MIRLKDVAERSGVSLKTVSNVVNNYKHVSEAMRTRVMKAILETGYVPDESARRLARGKTPGPLDPTPTRLRLGCIVRPGINKYDDPFHSRILTGIESEILKTRNIFAFSHSPTEFANDPMLFNYLGRQENLDGLITFVWHDEVREFFESHLSPGVPVCSVNHVPGVDSLDIDYAGGIRLLLDHLTGLGHRNIGYLGVTGRWYGQPDRRYLAFLHEMQSRQLPLPNYWRPEGGEFLVHDSGFQLATRLLTAPELPTALVCATDSFAIGAMKVFLNAGKQIPRDISITGFDDIPFSEMVHPALTTIHIDQEGMGRAAVRLLIERICDPALPPRPHRVQPTLIQRESSGNAPK